MTDWILFAIIVIFQGLDIITTYCALLRPGNYEANKIMSWLMGAIGVLPALIIPKAFFCGGLAAVVVYAPSLWLTIALGVISAGYGIVVVNNYRKGQ